MHAVQTAQDVKEHKEGLLSERNYLLLLSAKVISRFGDSVDSIAYSWMVYMLTGSKLLMGTLFAVSVIPSILLNFFSGVLVDRWSVKRVIIITATGRGTVVFTTGLMYFLGMLEPWHLFIFAVLNSSFEAFSAPAEMSLIPRILPKALLLKGNSITTSASRTAVLIGLGAAGTIIAWFGTSCALWIDAGTFLSSALIISFLSVRQTASSMQAWQPAAISDPIIDASSKSPAIDAGSNSPDIGWVQNPLTSVYPLKSLALIRFVHT